LGMPKVQAPDAKPPGQWASEPEARVEGSSFRAKPHRCAPAGNLPGKAKFACDPVHNSLHLPKFSSVDASAKG